jgi:hypothetical protein
MNAIDGSGKDGPAEGGLEAALMAGMRATEKKEKDQAVLGQSNLRSTPVVKDNELGKLPIYLTETIDAFIDTGDGNLDLRLSDLFNIEKVEFANNEPQYTKKEGELAINETHYRQGPMKIFIKSMNLEFAFGQDKTIPINKVITFESDLNYNCQAAEDGKLRYDSSERGIIEGGLNKDNVLTDAFHKAYADFRATYSIPRISNFASAFAEITWIRFLGYGKKHGIREKVIEDKSERKKITPETYTKMAGGLDDILKKYHLTLWQNLAEKINESNIELYKERARIEKRIEEIDRKKNGKGKLKWRYNSSKNKREDAAAHREMDEHKEKFVYLLKTDELKIVKGTEDNYDFCMEKKAWEEYMRLTNMTKPRAPIEAQTATQFYDYNPKFKRMFERLKPDFTRNLEYHTTRAVELSAQLLPTIGFMAKRKNRLPAELKYEIPEGQDGIDAYYVDDKGKKHYRVRERYTEGEFDIEENETSPDDFSASEGEGAAAVRSREKRRRAKHSKAGYAIITALGLALAGGGFVWHRADTSNLRAERDSYKSKADSLDIVRKDRDVYKKDNEMKDTIIIGLSEEYEKIIGRQLIYGPQEKRDSGLVKVPESTGQSLENKVDTNKTPAAALPKESAAAFAMDTVQEFMRLLEPDNPRYEKALWLNGKYGRNMPLTGEYKAGLLTSFGQDPMFWETVGANIDFSSVEGYDKFASWIEYSKEFKINFSKSR